jgi:hypothetical protein
MIKAEQISEIAEQIPDQAIAAFDRVFLEERQSGWTLDMAYRHAFAAALAAWPGNWYVDGIDFEARLILPLTQENNNGSD